MLAPGLVDLRVKTGEPGAEPKETLKSAARAAAAGGVTSIVVQPDTDPAVDEPAVVDFILRRARDIGLVHVYPAGAATKGLAGEQMAEIGLMREAGAVYVTDVDRPIVDSLVMRRVLAYAGGFGALVAHRPADPYLSAGAAATEGEFAGRMGLPRRLADGREDHAGARPGPGRAHRRAPAGRPGQLRRRAWRAWPGPRTGAWRCSPSASINHLTFNELDIGDYRTFYKLTPPLGPRTTARR